MIVLKFEINSRKMVNLVCLYHQCIKIVAQDLFVANDDSTRLIHTYSYSTQSSRFHAGQYNTSYASGLSLVM